MDTEHLIAGPGAQAPVRRGGTQIVPRPPSWRTGDAPPWSGADIAPLRSLADVRGAVPPLGACRTETLGEGIEDWSDFPAARPSAVLIALVDAPVGPAVLLTKRSGHLRNHRGEMSFPGGRLDEGEDPVSGALREAWEEIALPPSAVEPVGELSPLATFVSRSHIVPIVGVVRELPVLEPNPAEVDRIMLVPLLELVDPDVYRQEIWDVGDARPDGTYVIHFFELLGETVWGATGRMLVDLLSRVLVSPRDR